MDSSRRAVESYWRSRMIDGATSDEEKVTPVYKLEEICELLRSSHVSIVKEVSEFILKRLDHKSPIVKQKSGVEFRREMQRHSVAVRQLFHYKGQPDPLKGDALNKAVRDTAHEAISAIFSEQKNKPAPTEDLHRRIQGFGNTNFEMQSEDKKSFISEVVGLGSASIKRGLNSFTQGNSLMKNQNGSYKGPNLHRSLTLESDNTDGYEPIEIGNEAQNWLGISKNAVSGSRNPGVRVVNAEWTNGNSNSSHEESKTREERLVETIVTSGGVRLQPTRDAIQVFLVEAAKLDPLALCQALEAKLNSPQWQVKVRAVCLLDAIVRKKNDGPFSIVASYFSENKEGLIRCSESPQASLREKTSKVLSFLDREQEGNLASDSGKSVKGERTTVVQMPDLINTGDSDYVSGTKNLITKQCDENARSSRRGETPFIYDLLEDDIGSGLSTSEPKTDDDPFADVSFHTCSGQDASVDIFMGMAVDYNNGANGDDSTLFDVFGSSGNISGQENHLDDLNDLMTGLSINGSATDGKLKGDASVAPFESLFSNLRSNPGYQVSDNALNKLVGAQVAAISPDAMPPSGTLPYGIPPSKMFYPAFPSQSINYSAMGNFVAQQQFLAAISNFHFNANITAQNASNNHVDGTNGSQSSPFPDIFQANLPPRAPNVMGNNLKKQETKAFDFISDHLAAARDSKSKFGSGGQGEYLLRKAMDIYSLCNDNT